MSVLDLPLITAGELTDRAASWPVIERSRLLHGRIFDVIGDTVRTPSGETMNRQYVSHPGAVAVIALDDSAAGEDSIVLVRQYRHPAGLIMVEPPAGLLDIAGEDPLAAARRELAEEADLAADDWRVLVDYHTSPGMGSEAIRVYLARGLRATGKPDGFVMEGEEAEMDVCRARLDDLAGAILAGRVGNPSLVVGVLATLAARGAGYAALRPPDAPWAARPTG